MNCKSNPSLISNVFCYIHDIVGIISILCVSEFELRDVVSQCKDSMYKDSATVTDVTRSLIGRSRRVAAIGKHIVDASEDPLYRNAMNVFVTQLNKGEFL